MKASRKIKNISVAIIGLMIVSANYSFSQDENDDMYFRPDDRKEMKLNDAVNKGGNPAESFENKAIAKNTNSDVINPSYSPSDYGNLEENYSSKNVNPEYIARYKSNPKGTENTEELNEGDSYYDEYYDRKVMLGESDESTGKHKYNYPNSYYGGYNAMRMSRMYGSPWYDPFYGGFGPSLSLGLGYTFGYMPGFSMGFGYGTGWGYNPYGYYNPWGYGYSPYMSSFYDPFYSPWGYDPFYSPWGYNSMYSYRYPYGYPYYGYPSYGFYSGYTVAYINSSNNKVVTNGTESNRLANPSYRTRVSRGSDQLNRENQVASTSRTIARNNSETGNQSLSNARTASERDFSRSQNEYYSRNGSRNTTSTVSGNPSARTATFSSPSRSTSSTYNNTNTARVRSTRTNTDYARPSYQQSTREQRMMSSGSSGRSSWSNSGTYRSTRSSGSNYTPARSMSSGSSFSGSSGSSFRSSGSSSSGSFSSGSRSSGYSSGSSRSSRGNR